MDKVQRLLWNVDEAAEALNLAPNSVRRLTRAGKLRCVKLGARVLFDPADVAEFIEQAKAAAVETRA